MSDLALEGARRRGRAMGTAVYTVILSAFIVVCGTQVMIQGFTSASTEVPRDCQSGMLDLIAALRRARQAAASEFQGERASLKRFRQALSPEWDQRGGLAKACVNDPGAAEALVAIDRLRYAEEHAVRNESENLAPSRRQVSAIERTLSHHSSSEP